MVVCTIAGRWACGLAGACRRFDLPLEVVADAPRMAAAVRVCQRRWPGQSVLALPAGVRLLRQPSLLSALEGSGYDLALAGGVSWWARTPESESVLEDWERRRRPLGRVVADHPNALVFDLPAWYCASWGGCPDLRETVILCMPSGAGGKGHRR